MKKSSSHFEFRLIRQTSNLERIRPRTFGLKPASTDSKDEKPVLAKSKSSSAINLSLLRVRRNKLLEQAKKNCKLVHNEFDFIAFGGLNSSFGLRKCNSIDKVATTLDGLVEERRILEKFAGKMFAVSNCSEVCVCVWSKLHK